MTFQSWARISGIAGWAVLFLGSCVPGITQEPPASANSFVIRNARIFDGEKVSSQGDVWIQDGQIKAVGRGLKAAVTSLTTTANIFLWTSIPAIL